MLTAMPIPVIKIYASNNADNGNNTAIPMLATIHNAGNDVNISGDALMPMFYNTIH